LSALKLLHLGRNEFSGPSPKELGDLTELRYWVFFVSSTSWSDYRSWNIWQDARAIETDQRRNDEDMV
ncbi:unnamed protein product, partial [Ectocarpus sp. 12 AP-2014]